MTSVSHDLCVTFLLRWSCDVALDRAVRALSQPGPSLRNLLVHKATETHSDQAQSQPQLASNASVSWIMDQALRSDHKQNEETGRCEAQCHRRAFVPARDHTCTHARTHTGQSQEYLHSRRVPSAIQCRLRLSTGPVTVLFLFLVSSWRSVAHYHMPSLY